jgi:hypothetical protein
MLPFEMSSMAARTFALLSISCPVAALGAFWTERLSALLLPHLRVFDFVFGQAVDAKPDAEALGCTVKERELAGPFRAGRQADGDSSVRQDDHEIP